MSTDRLTITRPDDCHLHVRDGTALADVIGHTAERFARAVIMPNLKPPVTTVADALAYRERILAALPPGSNFRPLMTLYLTDETSPEEIAKAHESSDIVAVKFYPAGATTNSAAGVADITRTYPALEAMRDAGMPLLIHGEVTQPETDIFDRETVFIESVLAPLIERMPGLKIVLEHITTRGAVEFVRAAGTDVAATITPQHLMLNRNALLAGGLRPHHYCLPVLKRERDREALVAAATGGEKRFFLGTDSAPHVRHTKESACGCAGIYSAHAALEFYAEVFDEVDALDRLEDFASFHGADFYGLPRNTGTVTLIREEWSIPGDYRFADGEVVPLRAGEHAAWRVA